MRLLALAIVGSAVFAQPVVVAVRNAASYSDAMAPGCWIVIGGSNLAPGTAQATTVPLLKALGGVSVTIGGQDAPLLYVSENQINALVPFEIELKYDHTRVPVVVTAPAGASVPFSIYLSRNAPALFTRDASGAGRVHVFDPGFRPVDAVTAGDILVLYATGLGPTSPPAPSSFAGGSVAEPFNRVADNVEVFVGEQKAEVLFAGLAPGFPGVYQVNIRAPAVWTDRVYTRVNGWVSNIGTVGIKPRSNAIDAKAEFDDAILDGNGITLRFAGASFHLEFNVAHDAEPFLLAAVGETGGWFMKLDPANGMYVGQTTGPTNISRVGDHSGLGYHVFDLLSECVPLAGSKLPRSRQDPVYLKFLSSVPSPNRPYPSTEPSGVFEEWHGLQISSQRWYVSGAFGDYLRLPCGTKNRKTSFTIYIDGKAVATKEAVSPN